MKPLRLLGHPVHPPLVHLPLGLLSVVPVWDALSALGVGGPWSTLAFGCLAAGLLFSLPAMAAGFLDYAALEPEDPAEAVACRHMLAMLAAAGLFAASGAVRRGGGVLEPRRFFWAAGLALAGAGVMALGGWLGGELVYRLGAGRSK